MVKKNYFETPLDKINTVIGKGTYVEGSIDGTGLIRIDGEIKGSLSNSGDVIIGESGRVNVKLKARNVTVAGYCQGTVEAVGRLVLKNTSKSRGTFKAQKLLIEEGAFLSGSTEMESKERTGS